VTSLNYGVAYWPPPGLRELGAPVSPKGSSR
jgi:hypothetical protein